MYWPTQQRDFPPLSYITPLTTSPLTHTLPKPTMILPALPHLANRLSQTSGKQHLLKSSSNLFRPSHQSDTFFRTLQPSTALLVTIYYVKFTIFFLVSVQVLKVLFFSIVIVFSFNDRGL